MISSLSKSFTFMLFFFLAVVFISSSLYLSTEATLAQSGRPPAKSAEEGKGLSEGEKSIFESILKSHENVVKIHEENAARLGWLMTVLPGALFGMSAIVAWWFGSTLKETITDRVLQVASGELKDKQSDFSKLRTLVAEIETQSKSWKKRSEELNLSAVHLDAFNAQSSKMKDHQGQLIAGPSLFQVGSLRSRRPASR